MRGSFHLCSFCHMDTSSVLSLGSTLAQGADSLDQPLPAGTVGSDAHKVTLSSSVGNLNDLDILKAQTVSDVVSAATRCSFRGTDSHDCGGRCVDNCKLHSLFLFLFPLSDSATLPQGYDNGKPKQALSDNGSITSL